MPESCADEILVQVVGPSDGWVLERLARRLAVKLPYAAFVPWKPRPGQGGRLAYYVNYALYQEPSGMIDVGFFTHLDESHGFLDRARRLDYAVCMARNCADWLSAQGVAHVAHIPMGFDYYRYRARLVLGVVGRLDHPRKGRHLVEALRQLPFVEVLATEGQVAEDGLRDFYQKLDYVLIASTVEGGPMSLLEGLAMGKPIIAPEGVGIVPELGPTPHVRTYPVGDAEALRRLVTACYEEKSERTRLVQDRTWDRWAEGHHALFMRLLAERGVPLPEPGPDFQFGRMRELALPAGVDLAAVEANLHEANRHLYHGRCLEAPAAFTGAILAGVVKTCPSAAGEAETGDGEATMSGRNRKQRHTARRDARLSKRYECACGLAAAGDRDEARQQYRRLAPQVKEPRVQALIANDLAALAILDGDLDIGRKGFQDALRLDPGCGPARLNLTRLEGGQPISQSEEAARPIRVAVVSLLFNWPSTGGGTVHTHELALFLARAGYDVKHFYVRYDPWQIGAVAESLPYASEALDFTERDWNVPAIQDRLRRAMDNFAPDHVILTDAWNMKPLLAEAVEAYPYILRFQAMECLCPLNNVRLLNAPGGGFRQCQRHQLATPEACGRCLTENGHRSGSLHQAERALAGVGAPAYHGRLLKAIRKAEAVLVVNPLHEAIFSAYCERVRVVTSGMDPARFPWPADQPEETAAGNQRLQILFAGLVDEAMKGFAELHEACGLLWQRRQDFELLVTADPPGQADAYTRLIGWQTQAQLPTRMRAAAIVAVPTVAQEALGRTAVEAMGAGRPVVASRLGGLPFTVLDGATGLLCEPGDVRDLARKLETLLDDPALRQRLGRAGRQRFEEHYTWPAIIERHYRPLLAPATHRSPS